MQRRAFLLGASALGLSACGAAEPVSTPRSVLATRSYVHPGPSMLSLFTMKNVSNDRGMHTGLMINASQRVIFDPAGTFGGDVAEQPWGHLVPENNDLHFGITPQIEEFYARYHARMSYYVLRQDIPVSEAQAEAAFRAAQGYGAVPKAQCTVATTRILKTVPGFGDLRVSYWPDRLSEQIAAYPGVTSREYRETDSDNKSIAAANFDIRS